MGLDQIRNTIFLEYAELIRTLLLSGQCYFEGWPLVFLDFCLILAIDS